MLVLGNFGLQGLGWGWLLSGIPRTVGFLTPLPALLTGFVLFCGGRVVRGRGEVSFKGFLGVFWNVEASQC